VLPASCYGEFLGSRWEAAMTCWDKTQHISSYCWDGAQTQLASLTMRSMYGVLVARMEVLGSWVRCLKSTLCSATADLPKCSSRMCRRCSFKCVHRTACRACRTRRWFCTHLVSLVLGCVWQAWGNYILCETGPQTWCCVGQALCSKAAWGHCESAGRSNRSVWKRLSGTPTPPVGCLHPTEL
jgi:hypothetical protein